MRRLGHRNGLLSMQPMWVLGLGSAQECTGLAPGCLWLRPMRFGMTQLGLGAHWVRANIGAHWVCTGLRSRGLGCCFGKCSCNLSLLTLGRAGLSYGTGLGLGLLLQCGMGLSLRLQGEASTLGLGLVVSYHDGCCRWHSHSDATPLIAVLSLVDRHGPNSRT
ncbi:hypothetical protein ACFX1X_031279 [Malus domestica]